MLVHVMFFKYGQKYASFCLFLSFSQFDDKYSKKLDFIKA